jgi:hypothetical protein
MYKKRLGCISPTGLLAALITSLVILGMGLARGGRLFSPGKLNAQAGKLTLGSLRSHAETGGNCAACHASYWSPQSMSDRCLACHTDLTGNPKDFHNVMLAQSRKTTCYQCHTDHHGQAAALTVLDLNKFPHLSVGYSLQGHQKMADGAPFTCSDCHGPAMAHFEQATCTGCHEKLNVSFMQPHVQAYGSDSLACHDGVDRFGRAFDHNRLAFKLVGKHASVPCASCHNGARSVADFKSASQDCYACHAKDDPHQGKFGQGCNGCHTPDDWKKATFDHSLAAFQLTGAHARVACDKCHINNVFKGTPRECAACHAKDDAHQGKFGTDCAGCHTPDDWKKATFDHSQAAFQLTGAHANVACTQCHVNNVFKGTPQVCSACHKEPAIHAGLFGQGCETCHTTIAWSPAQFNGPHSFPLSHGANGPSACSTCHPTSLSAYTCYGCHVHNPANIEAKHREEGITNFADCIRCHPTGQGGG